ncbi:MAG: D-amino-acid oxidase [Burkholderiales bacterium PBB2]|nr:MAG: D-amino-acid oxidase [Burkholderiales bacterium PBB2]
MAASPLPTRRHADVIVIGGGIIGAACAREYARQGLTVAVVEPGPIGGGATAASMGHLLTVDALDPADQTESDFSRRSLQLWQDWLQAQEAHRELAEYSRCGTLWLAADAEELALAERKCAWFGSQGLAAEMLKPEALFDAEPLLRRDLCGALRAPDDGRVYPPRVAARWLQEAQAKVFRARAVGFDGASVRLDDGRELWGAMTVICTGLAAQQHLPAGWLLPKKGHLAITQRHPGRVQHQLVELGYLKRAHLVDQDTVSFNLQPRPGGQLLIGSSRQIGREDRELDPALLKQMLRQALHYMPGLGELSLLRCWTGVRPASGDGQPLIGAHPFLRRCWLATGHEGLGITTALATAELLVQLSLGQPCSLDPSPFRPERFSESQHVVAPA